MFCSVKKFIWIIVAIALLSNLTIADSDEDFDMDYDDPPVGQTSNFHPQVEAPEGFEGIEQLELDRVHHDFKTEVNRLMSILVNSLYSNVEVFLRELISNASDALEKLRFLSLTDKSQLDTGSDMSIRIYVDTANKMLHIRDYGIGMCEEDLKNSLGKIANSGTANFLAKLGNASNMGEMSSQIGQFGVGFYSSFLVANHVRVVTKSNGCKQYVWEADDSNFQGYTISEDPRGDTLKRGTIISLSIKQGAEKFLETFVLKDHVLKYSQFVDFPIYIYNYNATAGDPETQEGNVTWNGYWELINKEKPIWTRQPSEITEEEHKKFFNHLNNDIDSPLDIIHFKAEGTNSFTALLYIPDNYDIVNPNLINALKFYVKRVFIKSGFEDVIPRYLRFLVGVVDSDDFELNVSRETFQNSKVIKNIIKKIAKKVVHRLTQIKDSEPEKWQKIFSSYQKAFKLGIIEDYSNAVSLSRFIKFHSFKHPKEQTSLQEYVDNMVAGQKRIYYLCGESVHALISSPLLETLTAKGYDVLFFIDPIDIYMVNNMPAYTSENKTRYSFRDLGKEGIKIKEDEEYLKQIKKRFEPLLQFIRQHPPDKLHNVQLTSRLRNTPCALVAASNGTSAHMEKIEKSQYYRPQISSIFKSLRVFEINPRHPIIERLLEMVNNNDTDTAAGYVQVLYDSALVSSGFVIEHPLEFSKRMFFSVAHSLNVDLELDPELFGDSKVEDYLDESGNRLNPEESIDNDDELIDNDDNSTNNDDELIDNNDELIDNDDNSTNNDDELIDDHNIPNSDDIDYSTHMDSSTAETMEDYQNHDEL